MSIELYERSRAAALAASVVWTVAVMIPAVAASQGPGGFAAAVGFTAALRYDVRRTVDLTGTVRSRRAGMVASEVEGLVVELTAREGDRVRRGQSLVKLRHQTAELRLKGAEGQLQEARALLELAVANRRRAEELFQEQVFSRQQLDDALSQYDANEGRVTQLEAEVARLRDELERTVVRAPYDGVVVREHCAIGEWIGSGDPVAELVDIRDLEVTVEVPEQFFAGLTTGSPVPVSIAAFGGRVFEGRLRAVVPRADPLARTFPVLIGLPNPHGEIGVGMLARVSVPVGEPRSGVVVPKDALVSQGGGQVVFVIGDDDTVRRVPVRAGQAAGQWIAVEGGVVEGDRVVVQGNERLQPGQEVKPEPVEVNEP